MEIAQNIKNIIKEKMLIQSAVAKKAGYNPKTFNNMLQGRKIITANDIVRIGKALNVTPNELYGINGTV